MKHKRATFVDFDCVGRDEAFRVVAGRRRFNALRKQRAVLRLNRVVELVGKYGRGHGVQARIAFELNVSRSTISRDVAHLRERLRECPACGNVKR